MSLSNTCYFNIASTSRALCLLLSSEAFTWDLRLGSMFIILVFSIGLLVSRFFVLISNCREIGTLHFKLTEVADVLL